MSQIVGGNFCEWFGHIFSPAVSHSLATGPVVVFLGAACGSPYIVFISTSGM